MKTGKKILILGGGTGGIVTANKLAEILPKGNEIILIEKNERHSFAPSFLWLMAGQRTERDITSNVSVLLDKRVEIRYEEVISIDTRKSAVSTNKNEIKYDYLVVALGAELHSESISGLPSDAYNFYTLDDANKLYENLNTFKSGKIAVVIASLPFKCPAAPYEGAMLIADYYRQKGIIKDIEISLYTPEPLPMPVGGPVLGNAVKQIIESKGIHYKSQHKLYEVDGFNRKLNFEDQKSYDYDLLVVVPPHKAPAVIRQSELAGENGWIPVDRSTLKTKFPNVYAIGDNVSISIPGMWVSGVPMNLPKAGVFAHLQADTVAQRISDNIHGIETKSEFCGTGYCMLEAGEHIAGLAYGNFYGTPAPDVKVKKTGWLWHFSKVLFEKWWLAPIGFKKSFYKLMINTGSKIFRIPAKI